MENELEAADILTKLNQFILDSDQTTSHGDDPSVDAKRNEECSLIKELGTKYEHAVFKSVVMEARNANLLNEREALILKLEEENLHSKEIDKRLKLLEKNAEECEQIKEEYEDLMACIKNGTVRLQPLAGGLFSRSTSTTSLQETKDTCTCTQSFVDEDYHPYACQQTDEPTVTLTQSDIRRLDDDMKRLKESLQLRERNYLKLEKKNKNQRSKICRLDDEMLKLKEISTMRKQDIETKTYHLKTLATELEKRKREIEHLKKQIILKERYPKLKTKGKTGAAGCNIKTPSTDDDSLEDSLSTISPRRSMSRRRSGSLLQANGDKFFIPSHPHLVNPRASKKKTRTRIPRGRSTVTRPVQNSDNSYPPRINITL